ncbi:flagellar hook-associated protein FlgK [Methylobacterium sp. WL120]|uniref:flagellar hook-associated protein FlgK n=1 Tax=Methylobacterium sp. WL120 TaxID=2603887 RepID=UPI0011C81AD6|nr:flagellar hook-associated protein FlgK [Methylobacterium sp. WL120]TXM64660.1 flagellar hook-associated protein FlgK [Methylobacterium sp. WL120]
MSLNALSTATAGLAATQAAIGVVSQNIANAGTVGYVKRTLSSVTTGPYNSGVATGAVARSFDAAALRQLRSETSGAAYTSTKSTIVTQLDKLYGMPGSSTALDGVLNTFTASLQQLAANPTVAAARSTVVGNASALAAAINDAASGVQSLRTGVEARLGADTRDANALLTGIASLNAKIQTTTDSAALADFQDQRDQKINGLASYMDLQTVQQGDGSVTVLTQTGVTLVDRGNATALRFDGRGTLSPASTYASNPSDRTLGTVTATLPGGGTVDLGSLGVLRSGSLAAGIELRDQVLTQAQRQLDDLAAGLSTALTNTGTSGSLAAGATTITLPKMQAGNALTFPVTDTSGMGRNVTLVASTAGPFGTIVPAGQTTDANGLTLTFDASGDPATYAGKIQDAFTAFGQDPSAARYKLPTLGATGGTGSNVTLTAGGKIAGAASATTTVPTSTVPASGYPQIALFVDGSGGKLYTGSFDDGSQLTGFAQRIAVNPAIVGNTAALTASSATDLNASGSRAQAIYSALTATQQTFSSSSGIGGVVAPYSATVVGFAQGVISAQGEAASQAAAQDDTQQVALSTAQGRFSAQAGVSIDAEMSNLIALQTAYGANARILAAARDMLDQLLRI